MATQKYTDARKAGNRKWDFENLDRISIAIPKGKKDANLLLEIIDGILEAADELHQKSDRNLVEQGELIAYAESLCIIQSVLAGYDLAEYGLDFDIDAKYLS